MNILKIFNFEKFILSDSSSEPPISTAITISKSGIVVRKKHKFGYSDSGDLLLSQN